jgi:hypothetical protein
MRAHANASLPEPSPNDSPSLQVMLRTILFNRTIRFDQGVHLCANRNRNRRPTPLTEHKLAIRSLITTRG